MRTLFLFFVLNLIALSSAAQVTFEHSYSNTSGTSGRSYAFYTSTGLNYYTLQQVGSEMIMTTYNENHVFHETIPVNGEILFITDKLVNNDDEIEIFVKRDRYVTSPQTYLTKDIYIIDHLGNTLYTFYDRFFAHLVQAGNGAIKLIVDSIGNCNGCSFSSDYIYDVYGLSGSLNTGQDAYLEKHMIGFPIPAENILTLYNIPIEGQSDIEIFDSAGRKVLQSAVSGHDGEAKVDVSGLQAGTYICRYNDESLKFIRK